jgi:hypothetical protein
VIAPLHKPLGQPDAAQRAARRRAAALLPGEDRSNRGKPVPAWQAWMAIAWFAVTAVCYIISMLRSGV